MKFKPFILLLSVIAFSSCRIHSLPAADKANQNDEFTKNYPSFFTAENARVLGDTKMALSLYTEFVKQHPSNSTARYNLARLQYQKMDLANAEKNAGLATIADPANKFFREFYTKMLVLNKKNKQALLQYDHLLEKYPQDDEYLYDKAMLQLVMKDLDGAILSFEKLESSLGFNEDVILQKKEIFVKQGKPDLAVKEIEKLKQDDRSSSKYDLLIADIYASTKQIDKVKQVFDRIEKEYPSDPLAQIALAQYYLERNNTMKYNTYMQEVMKNRNLDVDTKIALIIPSLKKLETDTLQQDEVVRMAKSISEEAAGNKDAISLYADVLYFSKKYELALVEYRRYLAIDQTKISVWAQIIAIYSERQQLDSVISVSMRCIEVLPENSIPYFYVGISYLQKKETAQAITYLNKGLPLEKENKLLLSQYYSSLGDAYNTLANYSFSDSCFEKAIALQPSDATAMNNYAYYLSLRNEHLELAEKMSKRSLEIMPTSKSFLDTYGWILFQQGHYEEAQRYIKKAIEANGDNDGTLFEHLGDVYSKLGDRAKALENWKKAVEKGEHNPALLKKIQDDN